MALHPCPINAMAATENFRWLFTAGDDGFVRKYDMQATLRGDAPLTSSQKHMLPDTFQHSGVLSSAWENEEPPQSQTDSSSIIANQMNQQFGNTPNAQPMY